MRNAKQKSLKCIGQEYKKNAGILMVESAGYSAIRFS